MTHDHEAPLPLPSPSPSPSPLPGIGLCREGDVPEAGARGFADAGVFLTRHGGTLRAWRDACPHYGNTPLAWRRDAYLNADGSRIVCAAHGALFEPDTGLCVLGPCLGQSLTAVPYTLADDGHVFIAASTLSQEYPSP